jgi:non-canonical purine NTP pyrophosphatase (RdgB/HAM1 family)
MKELIFITGNQNKADYLARFLGRPVTHQKVEQDEIQSLDLAKVVEDKARQAYAKIEKPVLVEDVSLEFSALGRLPGTYIKDFEKELGHERLCHLLDGYDDRSATARGMFGYFDGSLLKLIAGELKGTIAEIPRGMNGLGWDPIFIPEGQSLTRAEMDNQGDEETYKSIKPFAALRDFLDSLE